MSFVGGEHRQEGCLFCRVDGETERDAGNLVLMRNDTALLMLNRYPYTSGHLMVAPRRHTADFAGLTEREGADVQTLLQLGVRALTAAYRPEGFNVGANLGEAAGAGIAEHLHFHIVPRWCGDTNFMSTVGGARVLPECLEETYARLRRALETILMEQGT
jgi:ATP adenylyltransferase